MAFLRHVWRLILAATVFRKAEAELDTLEPAPRTGLALPAPVELHTEPEPDEAPRAPDPAAPVAAIAPLVALRLVEAPAAPDEPPPISIDTKGWLHGDKVVTIPTVRKGYRWRGEHGKVTDLPSGWLCHWTATSHNSGLAMVKRTAKAPAPGAERTWVHLWIEHDGTIYQSGSLLVGAPHAGAPSSHRMLVVKGEPKIVTSKESPYSANWCLIGTEVVNVGEVRRRKRVGPRWVAAAAGDKESVWMGWPFGVPDAKGKAQPGPIVTTPVIDGRDPQGVLRYYQAFTPAQLVAIERLLRALRVTYGFSDAAMSWGHVDVDPTRKSDPGPFQRLHLPQILGRLPPLVKG
jgi:hypothetical protein